jgi:hypothetical protein
MIISKKELLAIFIVMGTALIFAADGSPSVPHSLSASGIDPFSASAPSRLQLLPDAKNRDPREGESETARFLRESQEENRNFFAGLLARNEKLCDVLSTRLTEVATGVTALSDAVSVLSAGIAVLKDRMDVLEVTIKSTSLSSETRSHPDPEAEGDSGAETENSDPGKRSPARHLRAAGALNTP